MTRDVISLNIADVSAFAKALRADLADRGTLPGHAAFLSAIAKAAGFENHQHLRAAEPEKADPQLQKALRVFSGQIMTRWPKQTTTQGLCLWAFWARLPARTDLREADVNQILIAGNSFGDHPLLRRSMIDHKLLTRTADGRIYRRIERAPSETAKRIIAATT